MTFREIWGWFVDRTQAFMVFMRALIAVAIGFKWYEWTPEQIAIIIGAMESFFAWITAKGTVTTSRISTIVDKEISHQISTGQIQSTGPGTVVQTSKTGTGTGNGA